MNYKRLNFSLIPWLLIFAASSVGAYGEFARGHFLQGSALSIGAVLAGVAIIYYVNGVNRKLAFFFEAIRNEDGSLHFPEDVKNKSMKRLHASLNRINQAVGDLRARQAYNERLFLEFMKRSATGLMAVDERDYVEIVNDAALRLIGLGYLTHMERLRQHNAALFEAMTRLAPGGSKIVKIIERGKLRQISIKVAPFLFDGKRYRIFSLSDIQAELEENELDTWQKLIRIMTHEIMNSIAPITSISKTLSKFYANGQEHTPVERLTQKEVDKTVQGLSVIEDRAQGLLHFVDKYRKLARIPKPVFKPIRLKDWLDSVLLLFQSRMEEERIKVEVKVNFPKEEFPGDEKILTQVALNLLNNAADAMEGVPAKKVGIFASENSTGGLKLEIVDNGKGFTEEEHDKIFIPFYTTKENGSGIGLSLSRQIMRLHKGTITAFSIPGRQTVFELNF